MKKIFLLCLHLCGAFLSGYAQQVDKGFELHELLKIGQVYRQIPHLSFEVEYTYADSARPAHILERLSGRSRISNGLYWGMLDSVEFVEGPLYSIGIFHQDSVITVSGRRTGTGVLQLPLMDSLFRAAQVDSMASTGKEKGEKVLTVYFRPGSVYSRYRLYYDARTSLVSRMEYYTQAMALSEEDRGSGVSLITVRLSGYSFDPVPAGLFREERVVSKTGAAFSATPAFAGFNIIDNTAK